MLAPLMTIVLAAATPVRVAVLPLAPGEGIAESTSSALTQAVAAQLRKRPEVKVLTQQELTAVLSVERQKQLMGCTSEVCLTELAGALDVQQLVTGSVAKLGQSLVLHLQRIDAKDASTLTSADLRKKGGSLDDVLDELPRLCGELFPGEGAAVVPPVPPPSASGAKPPPPAWANLPAKAERRKLKWVTDGRGALIAFGGEGITDADFFAGTEKALYRQRVFGGGREGDKRFSFNFWEPRARFPAEASFEGREGKYTLRCGKQEVVFTEVRAQHARKLSASAPLFEPRWQRRAYAYARDDEGNGYYVDQARKPEQNTDFRAFVGAGGTWKGFPVEVLASDSGGDVLRFGGGRLKLSRQDRTAEWALGGQKTPLTWLDIEDNVAKLYPAVYAGEALGTPCDGRF